MTVFFCLLAHADKTIALDETIFIERGLQLLMVGGLLGAVTSCTDFFLTPFQKWREEIILQEAKPTVFADLGAGVLDSAMVETAAYCLEKVKDS
jgi:hypothetical protein